jgi:hypothetical protein
MADITLLPSAKVPLIYDGGLTMTTEWYRFFWNLYGFTGNGVIPVNKGGTGLTTIGNHEIIIGNTNSVFEPAVLRGFGVSVTYDPGFVNISIGASGVTPGTYGNADTVGQFTINEYGSITFAQNLPIAISASQIVSGVLPVGFGGTGQSTYADGELLIGNSTGNTLTKATLTAGTGVSVTNGSGSITIANTGVLSVSGTAPVVSSGGATPAISMAAANTTTDGYLTSTDWNTFNNKAPATSGTSILYGNGTGGFSNVTIGSGVSFAGGTLSATGSGGTVTAVTGTAPIASSGGTTPAISISQATTSTDGYLSSTDWNTFNNKQPAGTYVTSISVASSNGFTGTSSGGATPALTLATSVTGILKGNGTAISAATSGTDYAPATSGTSILYGDGAGGFSNVTVGSGLSFTAGTLASTSGGGSVTSVTLDTGSTGLTVSGGTTQTITGAGTFTIAGTLGVGFGGTGTSTAFTAGSVVFAGASGVYTQDNTNLFWDNTNDRLGIGTSSPTTKLDVVGPASVTSFTGTTRLGITTKGSTAATDYSGIDFIGNSQTNPVARIAVLSTASGSLLQFGTSNSYGSGITNTAMSIDPSGNLLIGTTTAGTTGTGITVFHDTQSEVRLQTTSSGTGTSNGMQLALGVLDYYQWNFESGAQIFGTANTERMRIDSTGLITLATGSGLSISDVAVTSPAAGDGNVFSGTYTPSLTNTTNIAASTASVCQYMRVGNVVTVSGTVAIDPTAAGRIVMGMSLPIASNFSGAANCGGTFVGSAVTTDNAGAVIADATNDRATFDGVVADIANRTYGFSFTYRVI